MVHFDQATGALGLPLWASAALAVVLLVLAVMAVVRTGAIRTVFALAGLAIAGSAVWGGAIVLDRMAANERAVERRAFEQRAQDLITRSMLPNSPLSCLDDIVGEHVTLGCERVVFATPESVAAAVAYTHARLSLLVDGLDAAGRADDIAYEATLNLLRRGLEGDRYGIVAHVLMQQANCTAEQCEALALLRDPNKVRANLHDKTFDTLVGRYAANWAHPRGAPVAEAPNAGTSSAVAAAGTPTTPPAIGAPVASRYEFPSSNSIPPVSIMNSEPAQTPNPAATSASAPARTTGSQREPRRPPGVRPAAAARSEAAPAPVQLAPWSAYEDWSYVQCVACI
jgi:hypothetical protein